MTMSTLAPSEVVTPTTTVRRAGLSLIPLAAILLAIALALLTALTLPSSSSPSQDAAWTTVFWFWVLAVVALVVSACAANGPTHRRRLVLLGVVATFALIGWWVSRRLDVAWLDACDFAGSGDRCIGRDGSAPLWVLAAWPLAGLTVGCLSAGIVAIARHADRPELPLCTMRDAAETPSVTRFAARKSRLSARQLAADTSAS